MQKYVKKSETLHKPSQEHVDTFNINFDKEYRGTDGVKSVTNLLSNIHSGDRGVIENQSKDPFTHPAIDPGYLTHSADMEMMRQGVRFAIELSKAGEMGDYITKQENYNNNTDEAIDMAIRDDAHTEYHPLGTAAMLPLDKGGVVNTSLLLTLSMVLQNSK
ncbi:Choline dehydrogenase [Wallemia ichthyophaga EXF-994]|uniref:Choline dehydrogenase n=1 Tax=Wallemia ichthyophaga (strain EXF-994 / CBS 113033) TaxID=1299270 RepID=R9AA70_WALI9|nr:Choline dehydrogenase [Wallemia ichthyophaga EXF-994]EOQ99113.1 Choline dehydrogenase [Wallemia ichthyophaga EXF-994]